MQRKKIRCCIHKIFAEINENIDSIELYIFSKLCLKKSLGEQHHIEIVTNFEMFNTNISTLYFDSPINFKPIKD